MKIGTVNVALTLLWFFGLSAIVSNLVPAGQINTNRTRQIASPGLDVVVLLDQSGSMAGIDVPEASDPENRRIYTTQYLIDYLAFDNLYVNTERFNRISVIGFGNTAEILVPLTELKTKQLADDAKLLVVPKKMGQTNVIAALEKVREVLPSATDDETVQYHGLRRRMLILITDGAPNICNGEENVTYSVAFSCIETQYKQTLGLSQTMPMYVIGIQESSSGWETVLPFWQKFAYYAQRAATVDEVNRAIVEQVCLYANTDNGVESCQLQKIGQHFIQPYAKTVSFSFFKYQENATISLSRPNSEKVSVTPPDIDLLDYRTTPRDELFVMNSPQFGCWQSAREGAGLVDVFTQIVFNDLMIRQPVTAHPQILPLEFEFELRDSTGALVAEDPNLPIDFNATLTDPNGTSQPVQIAKTQDGLYTSNGTPPNLPVVGNYLLQVEGQVDVPAQACLPAGQKVTVFKNSFQIPVYAPTLVFSPAHPYLQYSPIQNFTIAFQEPNGGLLPLPENMPKEMTLTAQSPSGQFINLPVATLAGNTYQVPLAFILSETGHYLVFATLKDEMGSVRFSGQGDWEQAVNISISQPGENFPMGSPLKEVEVHLLDLQGRPTDPEYPLQLELALLGTNLERQFVYLEKVNDQQGVYRGAVDWDLSIAATYDLQLTGTISDPSSSSTPEVAFVSKRSVSISPTLPYFVVVIPEAGQEYNLFLGPIPYPMPQPVRVELRLINQSQKFSDLLAGNPDDIATVDVISPDGRQIVTARPLKLDPSELALVADLPELTEAGSYTLTFRFHASPRNGESAIGAWPSISVQLTRAVPLWVQILWWSVVLVFAVSVGIFGFLQTDNFIFKPKLKGSLYFEYGHKTPVIINEVPLSISLSGFKRHHIHLTSKQLKSTDLGIKQIVIKRIDFPAMPGASFTPGNQKPETGGVELEVIFTDASKLKAGGKLRAGGPPLAAPDRLKTVSNNKSYQIRYDIP